ncbi:MAG: hypothetical protein EOP49_12430, partial [Sphingobacteriales bacterium]
MKDNKIALFLSSLAFFITTSLQAQDCKSLFLLTPGAEVELSRFDGNLVPKGGKMINKVLSSEDAAGEQVTKVVSTNYTEAGEANSTTNLIYICDGKNLRVFTENEPVLEKLQNELTEIVEKKNGKSFAFASVISPIEYPLEIKEGMELKGHEVTSLMSFKVTQKELRMVGLPKRHHNYNTTGRYESTTETTNYIQVLVDREIANATVIGVRNIKVGSKEQVTVPAGTWECYKITKELYSRVAGKKEYGELIKSINLTASAPSQLVTEWYAPGLGIIKTEIKTRKPP